MTVSIEKLRQFQQQHLESQVQSGQEMKSVPKAGCVKEWALVEIALNLDVLNVKLDQMLRRSADDLSRPKAGADYHSTPRDPQPTS